MAQTRTYKKALLPEHALNARARTSRLTARRPTMQARRVFLLCSVMLLTSAMEYTALRHPYYLPSEQQAIAALPIAAEPQVPAAAARASAALTRSTGFLAAVGAGFLLYNALLALLGERPLSRFYDQQGPPLLNRRKAVDYPERLLSWLQVRDEACKQRLVCEAHQFVAARGAAGALLSLLSPHLPGMEAYRRASIAGLRNEDCAKTFFGCSESLGQRLLKMFGLSA